MDPTPTPLPTDVRVLRAIRRIIRAVDMHSKLLQQAQDITAPQLVCLLTLVRQGPLTLKGLSQAIDLSPSTTVGVVDRLAAKGLAQRARGASDRRQVLVSATPAGHETARQSPSPLQNRLVERLAAITNGEQLVLARSLERLVELMGAADIDASAILDLDPLTETRPPSPPPGLPGSTTSPTAPSAPGLTAAIDTPPPATPSPSRLEQGAGPVPLTRHTVVGTQPPWRKP